MQMIIIAFRDIKADTYLPPAFVPNVNAAIRDIATEINKAESPFIWAKYPEDHELWRLGTWESESAEFVLRDEKPKQLLVLSTLKG